MVLMGITLPLRGLMALTISAASIVNGTVSIAPSGLKIRNAAGKATQESEKEAPSLAHYVAVEGTF